MSTLILIPAYGRDYTSAAAAIADWQRERDFRISDVSSRWHGSYIGIADHPALLDSGITSVTLRFNQLRNTAQVQL